MVKKAKKKAVKVKATKHPLVKKKIIKKTASKKTKKVTAIPKGYNSITPYLILDNAAKAIAFYKKVFGAKEVMRMEHNKKIAHAELKIGDSKIMLADESPQMSAHSPHAIGDSPVGIHLYIKEVDTVIKRAVSAGSTLFRPVTTMFYGDKSGSITDPFGHKWYISTHVEDVTPAQMRKRAAELFGKK